MIMNKKTFKEIKKENTEIKDNRIKEFINF